jgi:hypothetical protein
MVNNYVTITGDSFEIDFSAYGIYYYPNATALFVRGLKSKNFMKFKLNRYVSFKSTYCKYNFIKINCAFIFSAPPGFFRYYFAIVDC